jgi:hypothetical protein
MHYRDLLSSKSWGTYGTVVQKREREYLDPSQVQVISGSGIRKVSLISCC